ncbi:MAG: hypothetical protein ACLFTR_02625 [Candidatus Woesearchaeota archaeon]
MDEYVFKRLCLALTLMGIMILYLVMDNIDESGFYSFIEGQDDDPVELNGKISSVDIREGYAFLEVIPEDKIRIVVFDDIEGKFEKHQKVTLTGRISEDEEFPKSIIADKIEKVE